MRIYNDYTFLNERPVRHVNYVVILLLIVFAIESKIDPGASFPIILSIFVIPICLSLFLTKIVSKRIGCYNPRTGKKNINVFKEYYFIVCLAFSVLLTISIFVLFKNDFLWVFWIPVAVFAFNIAFIPNLHFWIFEENIMLY